MTAIELTCQGRDGCAAAVTHIDDKGFVYCTAHGIARRSRCRCRKLRPAELARLRRGETIWYGRKPKPPPAPAPASDPPEIHKYVVIFVDLPTW